MQVYVYKTSYVEIYYFSDSLIMGVDWIGAQTVESVQDGCMQMLDFMKTHKTYKILNDNVQVIGEWNHAAAWVGSKWFPMMLEAGMQKFAWVQSVHRTARLSTEMSLVWTNTNLIPVRAFNDSGSAIAWLNEAS